MCDEQRLRELFDLFDEDGSGSISLDELPTLLRNLDLSPSQKQCAELLKRYDSNKDKTLSFKEFVKLVEAEAPNLPNTITDAELEKIFNTFDKGSKGYITLKDLKKMLTSRGEALSQTEVKEMFSTYDADEDGQLSFEEFKNLMTTKDQTGEEGDEEEEASFEEGQRVMACWNGGDTEYPGTISAANDDGTYDIDYDDGETEEGVEAQYIRVLDEFKKGQRVYSYASGKDDPFPGTITKVNKDDETYSVEYDDGETEDDVPDDWITAMTEDDVDYEKPKKKPNATAPRQKPRELPLEAKVNPEMKGKRKQCAKIWQQLQQLLPRNKESEEERNKRFALFKQFDINGNGYLSLAEVDNGCRKILHLDDLTNDLAPILIRAFTAAKAIRKGKGKSAKTQDEYVEKVEFRLLFVYIRDYFELWMMFSRIDTSGDRRVSLDEFKKAVPKLASWGINIDDPARTFKEIDKDHGGMILFLEFSDWAILNHLDIDDDEDDEGAHMGQQEYDLK